MRQAPCRDCPDRRVDETYNCHSVCEKYLAFVQKQLKTYDERAKESLMRDFKIQSVYRSKKRRGDK